MSDFITNKPIGHHLIELDVVDSTNNYAIERIKNGDATHGEAIFAHFQSSGKGQRGKRWQGAPNQNIALSTILDTTTLPLCQQFSIIAVAGLAAFDFFQSYVSHKTFIKWPNDIYCNDKKAVGVLTESTIKGSVWRWTVIGIGVNVNQANFDTEVANKAISLRQLTNREWDLVELSRVLCNCQEVRWRQLLQDGFEAIIADYNKNLYKKEQRVTLDWYGQLLEAHILHVDMQGQLHTLIDGKEQIFTFGEVKWVL